MKKEKPICPVCGGKDTMIFIHGCGWDYDRWVCSAIANPEDMVARLCHGEIELDATSYPDKEKK